MGSNPSDMPVDGTAKLYWRCCYPADLSGSLSVIASSLRRASDMECLTMIIDTIRLRHESIALVRHGFDKRIPNL